MYKEIKIFSTYIQIWSHFTRLFNKIVSHGGVGITTY